MKEQSLLPVPVKTRTIQTSTAQLKFPSYASKEDIMKGIFESLVDHGFLEISTEPDIELKKNIIKVSIKVWKVKENENK